MEEKILIIDDDEKLNRLLTDYLAGFGYAVVAATHPARGLEMFRDHPPQLVILDVMLPGMNGFEVVKEIRKTAATPIIMLTAKGDLMDRVVGLELGADDYLPKPFEPRELVARIQSVLRRAGAAAAPPAPDDARYVAGRLTVDAARRAALLDGQPLDLTTAEFELLLFFVKNSGIVLDREAIIEALHGIEWDAFNRSVDITVSRLRQKLSDNAKQPTFIKTVWGSGYVFIGGQEPDRA
jgi:DNA-binding response OmpR family regulator